MTPVTADAVRSAERVTFTGEALRFEVKLTDRGGSLPAGWIAQLGTPSVLAEFEAAAKKALPTDLTRWRDDFDAIQRARSAGMSVSADLGANGHLTFRVSAYAHYSPRLAFSPGVGPRVENAVLRALASLSRKVESIARTHTNATVVATATWAPGPGLILPGVSGGTADSGDELHQRLEYARGRQRVHTARYWFSSTIGCVLIGLFPLSLLVGARADTAAIFAMYGLLVLVVGHVARVRATDATNRVSDLQDEFDLSDLAQGAAERRAQKLFQVQSHQLRRYYEQALRQRAVIFFTGLLCIVAGFGVIGVAFVLLADSDTLSKQIVIASLGAVGGVLGNYIAVVYLRMFTETVKSIGAFHNRLVVTHHLLFANVLAAKVGDEKLRDRTFARMAMGMAEIDALAEEPEDEPPSPAGGGASVKSRRRWFGRT